MNVYVIIVTYGKRFNLLEQVVEATLSQEVYKVIIVDNASCLESKKKLKLYETNHSNKVKVIYLDENTGSAGGYKKGLEEVVNDPKCDFIWLLDDDNKPVEFALQNLLKFWSKIELIDKESKISLSSNRFCLDENCVLLMLNENVTLGRPNSFLGFDIMTSFKEIIKILMGKRLQKLVKNYISKKLRKDFVELSCASYGGLFFHKKLLQIIGFPDERFYLYFDDLEWTYRINEHGGKIYLIMNSKIIDIDKTIKQKGFLNLPKDPLRLYYTARNEIYFEINKLVSNKLIYKINQYFYLSLECLFNFKNVGFLIEAIKDAKNGHLGKKTFINK
ncbi:MAG: glycosyltransferase [Caldisphaera sp.]